MASGLIDLGVCDRCRGPLCTHRNMVCCEKCGQPQRDHPLTLEMQAASVPAVDADGKPVLNRDGSVANFRKLRKQPPQPTVKPSDFVGSGVAGAERVAALERTVAAQGEQIKRLERALSEAGLRRK